MLLLWAQRRCSWRPTGCLADGLKRAKRAMNKLALATNKECGAEAEPGRSSYLEGQGLGQGSQGARGHAWLGLVDGA